MEKLENGLRMGQKCLLKSYEVIPQGDEEEGMSLDYEDIYVNGFYLGKNRFYANNDYQIVAPEFVEKQSRGIKTFHLFADERANLFYSSTINNKEKFIEVESFQTEFFLSDLQIKYLNEYSKERIKIWSKRN